MSYVSAVAELFEQTGRSQLLTATAYTTIAEWEKEGIPLDLIRESVDDISAGPIGPVMPFTDISDMVESAFAGWLCTSSISHS